jgi:tetratricopeptide (TPR) repeat protein
VFLAVAGALTLAGDHIRGRYAEPRADLRAGLALLQEGDPTRAGDVLARGHARAAGLPFCAELTGELDAALTACEQARAAQRRAETARDLHALAQRIRFAAGLDPLPAAQAADLAARCRVVWRARQRLWDVAGEDERVRADLLDVAVIGAGLEVRLAPADQADATRRGALALLDEAEALCGPGPLLDQERARHGGTQPTPARPRNTWEAVCLGRSLLQAGEVKRAAELFAAAVEQSPGDFWAQFYHGLCAHRLGQHRVAAERFGVCVALAPTSAACYHNRALARTALGEAGTAIEDYTRALALEPALADAAFNRAQLHAKQGRPEEARRDLEEALRRGADPAAAHYQLAVLALAAKDRAAADASLRRALAHDPNNAAARELLGRMQRSP